MAEDCSRLEKVEARGVYSAMDNSLYLTPQGLKKLEDELNYLRTVRRKEVAERIRDALEEVGDLYDNSAYDAAKMEQSFLEGRIATIDNTLARARVIENVFPTGVVHIGSRVFVQAENGEPEVYMIVGSSEGNPRAGMISYQSPLGEALLEHRKGDEVVVNAPIGPVRFRIIDVS
jgi:transcription elongation factor GreA